MLNDHAKELVAALRSGKYPQGRRYLRRGDRYCLLGVACDVSGLGFWEEKDEGRYTYAGRMTCLPKPVQNYYSFKGPLGDFDRRINLYEGSLSSLNDSGYTFQQIADFIESEPDGLFKEEQP